jgi:hypothetical protein
MKTLVLFSLPVLMLAGTTSACAEDDAALIKSAESAAPAALSKAASIFAMNEKGEMRTLREGTNGWWCMPDSPATPGPDPMCGDANSMQWAMAWIGQKDPPKGKVGFMYMLQGGTDASNTDPYAKAPGDGNNWIKTGPHVMVVNAMDMMAGYPDKATPDTLQPYVMWPGTPYAHLMLPIE